MNTISQATQTTPAEELSRALLEAHVKDLQAKIRKPNSQPYFYLSGIHTCPRHLCYLLTDGDKRPAVNEYVQALFESGREQESYVKRKILEWGFEMMGAGREVFIKYAGKLKAHHGEVMAKGKIDGDFRFQGQIIPGEIKSMGEQMFKKLNTAEDLMDYPHTEKYLRQELMYMYGEGKESGVFILTDCRGHIKPIPIFLGNWLEFAEMALKKMEEAWEAKIEGRQPERIKYHSKICGKCDFATICLPDIVVGGSEVDDDTEHEAMVARHEELKPIAAEYKELHDELRDTYSGKPETVVCQHFAVRMTKQTRMGYDTKALDEATRKSIEKPTESWQVKVIDLTKPVEPEQ